MKKILALLLALAVCVSLCACGESMSTVPTSTPTAKPTPVPTPTPTPEPTPEPVAMPSSGETLYVADGYDQYYTSEFTVNNYGDVNYFMKFVDIDTGETAVTFFVRANSNVTITVPGTDLELRYAYGTTWYGEELLFGDATRYAKDEESYDFYNYTYTVSFETTLNTGEDMNVEGIDSDEF